MKIEFRKLQHLNRIDALALLDIRNQSYVRENMYDTSIISAESHLAWISQLDSRSDCIYWAVILDGQVVGGIDLASFDASTSFAEWGFYLDRKYFGIGAIVEYLGLSHFIDMGLCTIKACVKEENSQVLRMHINTFGFKLFPEFSTNLNGANYIGAVLTKGDWFGVRESLSEKMKVILNRTKVDWD